MSASPLRTARIVEFASWGFVALGVALPFAFESPPFAMYRQALAAWAFGAERIPAADVPLLGLMLGIAGGSIAGKWIVHALLARGPLAEGRAWARDLTLRGLFAWFLVDSTASLALGATFNVWMINLAPLALVGLPLLLAREAFPVETPAEAARAREVPAGIAAACFWTALAGALTGPAIAFGGTSPLFAPWFEALAQAQRGGAPLEPGSRQLALFFFGPVGGCVFAQFLLLAGFVRHDGGSARAATAGVASIAGWFLLDSAWGLVRDGLFNIAMVNLPALVVTLPPWLLLAGQARRRGAD